MKTILKIVVILSAIFLMAPEADAVLGVRRRSFRRGVVVGSAVAGSEEKSQQSSTAQQESATAQQESATAQQQSATAQQQSTAAQKPPAAAAPAAPAPAAAGAPLPVGTVVSALPPGCVSTPVGGVEYYYGGGNFYRAVFQGNALVYVTAQPK